MGRLILEEELGRIYNPAWYITDAQQRDGLWRYSLPCDSFPAALTVRDRRLSGNTNNTFRIQLRRWIEQELSTTVILRTIDHSYFQEYADNKVWEHEGFTVRNIYWQLFFESESDMVLFKMRWGEYISEIKLKLKPHEYFLDE